MRAFPLVSASSRHMPAIAPSFSTVLLGQRVEVVYRDGYGCEREEIAVVVGVTRTAMRLTKALGYDGALGAWLPPRPRTEWIRERTCVERVTVLQGPAVAPEQDSPTPRRRGERA